MCTLFIWRESYGLFSKEKKRVFTWSELDDNIIQPLVVRAFNNTLLTIKDNTNKVIRADAPYIWINSLSLYQFVLERYYMSLYQSGLSISISNFI